MSALHLWFGITSLLLFGGAGLLSLVYNTTPQTPHATLWLLLLLGLLITVLSVALHAATQLTTRTLWTGLRRGLLLAAMTGLMLYFNATQLLSWWNTVPLLVAVLLIEVYWYAR